MNKLFSLWAYDVETGCVSLTVPTLTTSKGLVHQEGTCPARGQPRCSYADALSMLFCSDRKDLSTINSSCLLALFTCCLQAPQEMTAINLPTLFHLFEPSGFTHSTLFPNLGEQLEKLHTDACEDPDDLLIQLLSTQAILVTSNCSLILVYLQLESIYALKILILTMLYTLTSFVGLFVGLCNQAAWISKEHSLFGYAIEKGTLLCILQSEVHQQRTQTD